MSAKDLAQAAGLSAAYVSQIEGGKRDGTVGAYRKMAKVLRVTLDDLTWEAPPKRKKRKVVVKGR
jgi:transcriptional regulator with XRE-family HTH domain